jgi:hypothetical protein
MAREATSRELLFFSRAQIFLEIGQFSEIIAGPGVWGLSPIKAGETESLKGVYDGSSKYSVCNSSSARSVRS